MLVIGAWCWLLTVLYFAVQPVVAAAWPFPYSITQNTISDLGVTTCGPSPQLGGGVVPACSPRHALMNVTFVLVGVLTAVGGVLVGRFWPPRRLRTIGVAFVVVAGIGGVLVGLAPADTALEVHAVGALLQVPGAIAPLLLGLVCWSVDRVPAVLGVVCGVVGTVSSLVYFARLPIGLIPGITERLAFDPLTVWTVIVGLHLLLRAPRAEP